MRVLIASAGDLLAEAIQHCLKPLPDVELRSAPDSAALLYTLENQPPDVLLLDDLFEQEEWIGSLVTRLKELAPRMEIAVIGTYADGALVAELFEAGIKGFLYRGDVLHPGIENALRTVRSGKPYLSLSASSAYLIALRSRTTQTLQRDKEALHVLRLLAMGKNIPEIAAALGVKPRRVYWVQTKLRQRFNVPTNEAVISKASQQGYLRSNS